MIRPSKKKNQESYYSLYTTLISSLFYTGNILHNVLQVGTTCIDSPSWELRYEKQIVSPQTWDKKYLNNPITIFVQHTSLWKSYFQIHSYGLHTYILQVYYVSEV